MPRKHASAPGERARGALVADWPAPANVHAFTTLRHGAGGSQPPFDRFNLGLRSGDDEATVLRNREALARRFGLPAAPRWLRQVHGTGVVRFGGRPHSDPFVPVQRAGRSDGPHGGAVQAGHPRPPQAGAGEVPCAAGSHPAPQAGEGEVHCAAGSRPASHVGEGEMHCAAGSRLSSHAGEGGGEPEADAAVTDVPGLVLAVLTADCLPVVFAAADGREVAVAHAGWRGLAAGVLEHAVAAMRTPPGELLAWLGPAAGPDAYEVGEEVCRAFVDRDAGAATAFAPTRPGHWRVDLYALARRRLAEAGVTRIHGGGLCTISDPRRFHSHRRDGRSGRMATVAWIEPIQPMSPA